jgi:hypothetical protein
VNDEVFSAMQGIPHHRPFGAKLHMLHAKPLMARDTKSPVNLPHTTARLTSCR